MDASILQLFAPDEILERLARKQASGCFKVFTPLDSGDVFFKKGVIVAAKKGRAEGEEALQQILQWREAFFLWQQDLAVPASLKQIQVKVADLLASQKTTPGANPEVTPPPTATQTPSDVAATTTLSNGGLNGATVSTNGTANEEELLRRNPLVLVSVEKPDLKIKLTQVSNLLGRTPTCNISIPDTSISRQHCVLQITNRGLYVKDLNTVNGTKINGIVLKEGYINVGDKLTVGHIHFALEKG